MIHAAFDASLLKPLTPEQHAHLDAHLEEHEMILGVEELTDLEGDTIFLMLSTSKLFFVRFFPSEAQLELVITPQTLEVDAPKFGRIKLKRSGEVVAQGDLFGPSSLISLLEAAAMDPLRRLLRFANACFDTKNWLLAQAHLTWTMEHLIGSIESIDLPDTSASVLTPTEEVFALGAQTSLKLGLQQQAIDRLVSLSTLRPDDALMETTRAYGKDDLFAWMMLLVIAHEEADDFVSMAKVYGAMADQSDQELIFRLQQARSHQQAGETDDAIQAYATFVTSRCQEDDFRLISSLSQDPKALEQMASDPELVAACLELGELQESKGLFEDAASTYLTLIRQAPFALPGYERFFALSNELEQSDQDNLPFLLGEVASLLRLLSPSAVSSIEAELQAPLPPAPEPAPMPAPYPHALSTQEHDEHLVHEGERDALTVTQKAINQLMQSKNDAQDIIKHCQRVEVHTHVELAAVIRHVCDLVGIEHVPCYLSHGMTGIQLQGDDKQPLLLFGAAHLTGDHPQSLELRQQCFAVATQIEHIRAKHLVLTNSEMWSSIRDHAMTGAVSLLSLVPLGDVLGKFTNKITGSVIGAISATWKNTSFQSLLGYTKKKVIDEGAGKAGIQTAYEATLARLITKQNAEQIPQESMLKEQLADFARCAMYTADRLGLLACDSLHDAVEAILRLSPKTAVMMEHVEQEGLEALLRTQDAEGNLVYQELAMRLGELFKFALSDEFFALRASVYASAQVD